MRVRTAALGVTIAVLLVLLSLPADRTYSPDRFQTGSLQVSATATPSVGPAPLLVAFAASVPSGTPTGYNWSFGDGSYLNGTSSSEAQPTHEYVTTGNFTARVVVWEGTNSGSASVKITVTAGSLVATVTASPAAGTSPLTVTFTAQASGGTGTYVWINWTYGDGASAQGALVRYTYRNPGHYYAILRVQDSAGTAASAGVWVNVSADTAAPAGITLQGAVLWAAIGFGLGAVVVLLAFPLRDRWSRRGTRTFGVRSPPSSGPPSPTGSPGPETIRRPAPTAGPAGPLAASLPAEALRLSQRTVVHLAGQGTLGPYDVAPFGTTQAGMSAALGVRQNALTNVLRRLAESGVVEVDVRHVRGQPRRLKVYRLTPRGELLARELRHRPPPGPAE